MLQPCMMLRHPDTVYDLRRGSLRDSMTRFFPGLRTMRATNADYLARCARCFLKGLCEQCPAKSWMEHGTLDTPVDYLCQVAHAQARYLGLVGGSEWAWEVSNWRERIKAFAES
jgi:radical SAM protein with 4Fe4S-binding SPASM domain